MHSARESLARIWEGGEIRRSRRMAKFRTMAYDKNSGREKYLHFHILEAKFIQLSFKPGLQVRDNLIG